MFTTVAAQRRRGAIFAAVVLLTTSLAVLGLCEYASAEPQPAPMWVGAALMPLTGESFYVSGGVNITDDLTGQRVSLFKREMGENTDTLLAELPLTYALLQRNHFSTTLPGLTHSAIITATWAGDANYAPSATWNYVRVRGKVSLQVRANTTTYLRLRSEITPLQPKTAPAVGLQSPLVDFQRKVAGRWRSLGWGDTWSSDLTSVVQATYYHLKPGIYTLRARFVGTSYNTAAVSRTLRVTVR